MISFAFSTLFPLFAILALGAVLRKKAPFLSAEIAKDLNQLVFWVALPAFIVHSISNAKISAEYLEPIWVIVLSTFAAFAITWSLSPLLGVSRFSRGTFCQCVFRSNNAYVGIPVLMFAFQGRPESAAVNAMAVLTLAPSLILYNVLAVLVLTRPEDASGPAQRVLKVLKGVFRNPLVLACIAGVILLALRITLNLTLWTPVQKTLSLLGQLATPGSLLALGASLSLQGLHKTWKQSHAAAALKLGLCPALGVCFSLLLGLDPLSRFVAITFLACPCAVASFIMAQAMKGDAELAASSVALSTIYSIFSLAAVLLFAMPAPV